MRSEFQVELAHSTSTWIGLSNNRVATTERLTETVWHAHSRSVHNTTQGADQKTCISVSRIQAKTKHHKANNPQCVHSNAYATSYLWIQVRCSAGESHTLIQSSACLNPTNLWDLPSLQQCQCPCRTVICLTRTMSSKLRGPAANE